MRGLDLGLGLTPRGLLSGGGVLPQTSTYSDQQAIAAPHASLFPGGAATDFSFGAWFKIIERLDQYVTFFCMQKTSNIGENGSYFWFGYDSAAGGGSRGLAVYGNNGTHSYDLLPATGTWFHASVTKQGNTVRAYLNGILCDWDGAAPDTNFTADIGNAAYDEINRATIARELDVGDGDKTRIAVRAAWFTEGRLLDAQIAAIMQYSDPWNYDFGARTFAWPLVGGNLSGRDPNGAASNLTGTVSSHASSPAGIILP
jgi:hypothetical protein